MTCSFQHDVKQCNEAESIEEVQGSHQQAEAKQSMRGVRGIKDKWIFTSSPRYTAFHTKLL